MKIEDEADETCKKKIENMLTIIIYNIDNIDDHDHNNHHDHHRC